MPRLKRLFANPKDAKNLRWNETERSCDALFCHLADSMQWKNINQEFRSSIKNVKMFDLV